MADESTVYGWLAATSAVTALVSTRIYAVVAPQNAARPFLVYSLISAVPQNELDGVPGCANYRVQIDSYATTYAASKAIGNAARDTLESNDRAHLISEGAVGYESETELYRDSRDYSVWLSR